MSTITEIEAHEALLWLLRLAQFTFDTAASSPVSHA